MHEAWTSGPQYGETERLHSPSPQRRSVQHTLEELEED